MELIARSYKYRLYPTADQEQMLSAWQSACFEVQRAAVIQRRIAWDRFKDGKGTKIPNYYDQQKDLTELRQSPFFADVPCIVAQEILRRIDAAYKKMRADIKAGKQAKVRWSDKPEHVGLTFLGVKYGSKRVASSNKFEHWKLAHAGKLGLLKIRTHRRIPQDAVIKQIHITKAADGWYVSFSCELPKPEPLPSANVEINGVDLGCIHEGDKQRIAVVNDGRIYRATDNLKRSLKRRATLNKLVSNRRTRGTAKHADQNSKRTAKRRATLAKLDQRIARQRESSSQFIAKRLVDTANVVSFEDIDWSSLRRTKTKQVKIKNRNAQDKPKKSSKRAKRGLNRSMATAAPARIVALAKEKAEKAGRRVVKVNARNTSQACSSCGVIGEKKSLNIRAWECAACGVTHDRDVNAAKNIAQRGKILIGDLGHELVHNEGLPREGDATKNRKRPSVNLETSRDVGGGKIAEKAKRRLSKRASGKLESYTLPLMGFDSC